MSFRDGPLREMAQPFGAQDQTRNLEIPDSRVPRAPE
jgi:hypothetical protein